MTFTCKASFANASPVVSPKMGAVSSIAVPQGGFGATPNGNTLINAADPKRAVLVLRNEDTTHDLRYGYTDDPALLTNGFLLKATEAIDIEPKQTIYAAGTTATVQVSIDERTG